MYSLVPPCGFKSWNTRIRIVEKLLTRKSNQDKKILNERNYCSDQLRTVEIMTVTIISFIKDSYLRFQCISGGHSD